MELEPPILAQAKAQEKQTDDAQKAAKHIGGGACPTASQGENEPHDQPETDENIRQGEHGDASKVTNAKKPMTNRPALARITVRATDPAPVTAKAAAKPTPRATNPPSTAWAVAAAPSRKPVP